MIGTGSAAWAWFRRHGAAGDVAAHRVLFPLAMLLALVEIPLWAGLYRRHPGLAAWHAHEMLFGYALAVVAGFLLARVDRRVLAALVVAWVVARLAPPLGWPGAGGAAALGFAWGVTGVTAARFLRAARKGRNQNFVVVLLGMGGAATLFQAGTAGLIEDGEWRGILLMLDLVALIMLLMGGRVIPAATAGALQRRKLVLRNRVQPWVETLLAACMFIMAVADQVPVLSRLAGVAALLAAILAGFRLLRWRGWLVWRVFDLAALHLAYAWLVVGLGLKGAAGLLAWLPVMAWVHAIGIGALGILTVTMMLRTNETRLRSDRLPAGRIACIAVLMTLAGSLRIEAAFSGYQQGIWAAAGLWTAAVLVAMSTYARRA